MRPAVIALTFFLAGACSGGSSAPFQSVPVGPASIQILRGDRPYLGLELIAWGPNWSWAGIEGASTSRAGATALDATIRLNTGATLRLTGSGRASGGNALQLELELSTDRDTDLTLVCLSVGPDASAFAGGRAAFGSRLVGLPLGRDDFGNLEQVTLRDAGGKFARIKVTPALAATADGGLRLNLAAGRLLKAQPVRRTVTVTLPGALKHHLASDQVPDEPGSAAWFDFQPSGQLPASAEDELSLAAWLERPAGKGGRIAAKGEQLIAGGKPIKLWGINVCYADCAPPKELAEARACLYARNGINAVRLHKYADGPGWAGIQAPGSFAKFDPEALDRMDYFVAKLKEQGIYVKLSPTFGVAIGPDDLKEVPFASELGALPPPGERLRTGHGAIYLSRELQDLQIRQTVAILKHRNPYTGLTYGEDPAVAIVEFFNEDSALFFGTMERLQRVPTLRKRAAADFTAWLKRKYGAEAKLREAWGPDALNSFVTEGFTGESFEAGTIVPAGNPWFFDPTQLEGSQKPKARRLHDTMAYLYELQNGFYDRFRAAVRASGYDGLVMASNWIAGRGFSHFYNLHSDARMDLVDRHNYFGGGGVPRFDDGSMLARPGSGILSMGLSQVAGKPFSLSEWIHVYPSEWGAEGPALLAAYGMGLNGWDVSFIFQNRDSGGYSDRIGRDQWDATAPQVLTMLSAWGRTLLRGDLTESSKPIPRNVHIPSLLEGRLGFDDQASAEGDVKTADGSTVPAAALAVGKNVVRFTDRFESTPAFDPMMFRRGNVLLSDTGQLGWTPGDTAQSGWFWTDTPGTQAVVGFAGGQTAELKDVSITPKTRFAAIVVSARGREERLADAKSMVVTAIARARNTGMKVLGPLLLSAGQGPIRLEPVVATLRLKRGGNPTVHILDHDGRRAGRTVPVRNGVIEIDTGRDRAFAYLIVYT